MTIESPRLPDSKDKLPDGWGAERFKIVEGGAARVGIKGTAANQPLAFDGRGFTMGAEDHKMGENGRTTRKL